VRELSAQGDPDLTLDWVTQLSRDSKIASTRSKPARSGEPSSPGATRSPSGHAHVSKGPTEAADNLIKRVKRAAFGFREFRNTGSGRSSTPGDPTVCCSRRSALADLRTPPRGISSNHEPVGHAAFGQHHPRTFQDRCSGRPNAGRASRSTRRVLSDVARAPHAGHWGASSRVSTSTHNPSSSSTTPSTRASGKPIIIAGMRARSFSVRPSMCEGWRTVCQPGVSSSFDPPWKPLQIRRARKDLGLLAPSLCVPDETCGTTDRGLYRDEMTRSKGESRGGHRAA
jgi:hypothetical protein